jgi:hypothetical protein
VAVIVTLQQEKPKVSKLPIIINSGSRRSLNAPSLSAFLLLLLKVQFTAPQIFLSFSLHFTL